MIFTDIDEPNKMDKRPFFVLDVESFDDADIRELEKFQKEEFNIDRILETASRLKFTSAAVSIVQQEISSPSDDLIKLISKQFYEGIMTKAAIKQLRPPIKSAFEQIVRDRTQQKFSAALSNDAEADPAVTASPPSSEVSSEIETTEDEWQAFYIVRAIASQGIEIDRITIRDATT